MEILGSTTVIRLLIIVVTFKAEMDIVFVNPVSMCLVLTLEIHDFELRAVAKRDERSRSSSGI